MTIAAQDRLIADENAVDDAAVGERDLDAELDLLFVHVEIGPDPDAERHGEAVARAISGTLSMPLETV